MNIMIWTYSLAFVDYNEMSVINHVTTDTY